MNLGNDILENTPKLFDLQVSGPVSKHFFCHKIYATETEATRQLSHADKSCAVITAANNQYIKVHYTNFSLSEHG